MIWWYCAVALVRTLEGNFNSTDCVFYCKHWRCNAQFHRAIISCKFWVFISPRLQIKRHTRFRPSSARTKLVTFSTYPPEIFTWIAVWVRTWCVGPTLVASHVARSYLAKFDWLALFPTVIDTPVRAESRESTATRTLTLLNLHCVPDWPNNRCEVSSQAHASASSSQTNNLLSLHCFHAPRSMAWQCPTKFCWCKHTTVDCNVFFHSDPSITLENIFAFPRVRVRYQQQWI